jgi:methionine sulfoxide reductase catalytic subunit
MIKIKKPSDCRESEITPESLYLKRRQFMKSASLFGLAGLTLQSLPTTLLASELAFSKTDPGRFPLNEDDQITDYEDATSYNNFYEFGIGKSDPAENAKNFDTTGWKILVSGACENPGELTLDDLISYGVEERIYRLRCVEAWSMVIPWLGVELGKVLKKFKPTSNARYVRFKTLLDPQRMPGQNRGILDWPYEEGLRIDEAMNPLAILSVGMYGKTLPGQNGAPVRLVVPWKYGFKSIKSIVSIEFTEQQPLTTWHIQGPNEYGFYANVNPEVDHPRWSQARERRIGDFFKRKTLMFNGYSEEVASLYSGMDLRKNF